LRWAEEAAGGFDNFSLLLRWLKLLLRLILAALCAALPAHPALVFTVDSSPVSAADKRAALANSGACRGL
jgi:hypothetical protein